MMKSFQSNSYLFGGNAPYVEELYENYLDNPASVPEVWRAYFDNMQALPAGDGNSQTTDVAHAPVMQSLAQQWQRHIIGLEAVIFAAEVCELGKMGLALIGTGLA